jgi:hypothetical protein
MQLGLRFSHKTPLIVCYGAGRDSTALLVGLWLRGIKPDAILFADVGAERPATYAYLEIMNEWLASVGFPKITIVRYVPKDFKHYPPYLSLEENLLTNVTLPSIAYGSHTCSAKWKIQPINLYCDTWAPALLCWSHGGKCRKAIGFEDSPHERKRAARGCATFATQTDEFDKYDLWFPLQEWGWNLERCIEEIKKAGLPVPPKSSCYFCTAMKTWEVDELDPRLLRRIVVIEARTAQRHLAFAKEKAEVQGVHWNGKPLTAGLWRKEIKGKYASGKPNGATPRPGSMTEYIRQKELLPSDEIDRIIAATPTQVFSQEDFTRAGIGSWQDWLASICEPTQAISELLSEELEIVEV